jgi:hypothetical protein
MITKGDWYNSKLMARIHGDEMMDWCNPMELKAKVYARVVLW